MKKLLAPLAVLAAAGAAQAAPVTVSQTFEGDLAGFQAALAGATFVTVDFETFIPNLAVAPVPGTVVPAGTVAPGNVPGEFITLEEVELALDLGGNTALSIGRLFGEAGTVTFSRPVIGVGATFMNVSGGAFGGAFVNFGFDTSDSDFVGDSPDDVTITALPTGPIFLGFTAATTFASVGISTFPSFGVDGQIDNLVFAFAPDEPPVGAVPLPAALPLLLTALGGLAAFRRFGAARA